MPRDTSEHAHAPSPPPFPADFRKYVADLAISDVWPIALVSGWIYVSATLWSRNIKAGLRSLGVVRLVFSPSIMTPTAS